MTYADGEKVTYSYNAGGLLRRMTGEKKGTTYTYVEQLGYDKFVRRSPLESSVCFWSIGNGTKTTGETVEARHSVNSRDKSTIFHELGHNLGFEFSDNPSDRSHSKDQSHLMYKNTGGGRINQGDLKSIWKGGGYATDGNTKPVLARPRKLPKNLFKMDIKLTKLKGRLLAYSLAIAFITFQCCIVSNETLKLTKFQISLPSKWETTVIETNDGYNGLLLTEGDSIIFNFGAAVSNLSEDEPNVVYIPLDRKTVNKHFDTSKFILAEKQFFDIDEYRKQNVSFLTIDGFRSKITYPRRPGYGITGVYIDSIDYARNLGNSLGFHLYGKDLSESKEKIFYMRLKAFPL